MASTFFLSWALWLQMTFVLGVAILCVFAVGLIKLWWTNRILKKHALLDEEKRARLQEMRRSGLNVKRGYDIPFGVRAIQNGVHVDGIWYSRPTTPDSTMRLTSSTTLVADSDLLFRGKGKSPPADRRPATRNNSSESAAFLRNGSTDDADGSPPPTPHQPVPNFSKMRQYSYPRPRNGQGDGDSSRRVEERGQKLAVETYIPTTSITTNQPAQTADNNGAVRGRGYGSSDSSSGSSTGLGPHPTEVRSYLNGRAPDGPSSTVFATPPRTSNRTDIRPSTSSRSGEVIEVRMPLLHTWATPIVPEPTFGPGDLHVNRASRRVNGGFEILPAGTFGPHQEFNATNPDAFELESGILARPNKKQIRRGSKLQKQRRLSIVGERST